MGLFSKKARSSGMIDGVVVQRGKKITPAKQKPIGGLNRGWGTAGTGWVDVDPSGNRMNRKQAKKDDKEDAKWETMTKKEYEEYVKKNGKPYGVERDGRNFRVKTKR